MNIEMKHDYSISMIRLIATAFITTCHIMQYLDIELAWWFNVGVQIFLCMSGFLYGRKGVIENDFKFYTKNLSKILIDYYVVIFFSITLFSVLVPEELSFEKIMNALLARSFFSGGEHLWYIPYCLFCYFITPFLCRYFYNYKNRIVGAFFIICGLTIVMIEGFLNYFNAAWIVCYIIGFFLGNIQYNKENRLYKCISFVIITGAIVSNSVQIILDYVIKFETGGMIASLYNRYCNYSHVALGVALFVIFKFIFSKLFEKRDLNFIKKLCTYSDKYSYDIYLVHQFVILGPLSLMSFTDILGLNIVLILMIILLSAVIVNFISKYIRNRLEMLLVK